MQRMIMVLLALAIAGCAPLKAKKTTVDPYAKDLRPGCYTVDLFDPYVLQYPEEAVPAANRDFLGVWRQGDWGGNDWCHDLYVTAVYPDGSVDVLDLHGPKRDSGLEATVFKRKGFIENGVLTLKSIGYATVNYRREGQYLLASRDGIHGKYSAVMVREEKVAQVPIPPANPRRQRG